MRCLRSLARLRSVADALEAGGHDVEQEAAQEFLGG